MHIDVIRGKEAFAALRDNWNAVYAADPEAHIFMSWAWTADWFARLDFNWLILAAKTNADALEYVALFPLQVTTEPNGDGTFYNELRCANWDLADAGGFLCHPDFEDEAIPALAKYIKELRWTGLLLKHFNASPKRLRRLTKAFPERKYTVSERQTLHSDGKTICNIFPYVDLPETWNAFLDECLSSNTRQKARRFLKRLDESGEFRVTHADAGTIERDVEKMLQYWQAQWLSDRPGPLTQKIVWNYRVMVQGAFQAGNLFMPILWQGERPLAILATLIDRDRKALRFYMGGRDESFNSPPPGFILHAYSIRWAIENGFKIYDLLQGDEPYKYMWGAKDRYLKTIYIRSEAAGIKLDQLCLPFVLDVAKTFQREGKVAHAQRAYRQVLEADPKSAPALLALAKMRAFANDFAEAEVLLKDYVALDPNSTAAWLQLGKIQQGLGNANGAATCYRKALALDPSNAEATRLSREALPLDSLLDVALEKTKPTIPQASKILRS